MQQFSPVSIQQALMRWCNIRWRSAKCWWLVCLERFHAPRYIPFENGGLISHQNEAASDSITEAPKSIGWSKHGVISGVAHPNRVLRYIYIYPYLINIYIYIQTSFEWLQGCFLGFCSISWFKPDISDHSSSKCWLKGRGSTPCGVGLCQDDANPGNSTNASMSNFTGVDLLHNLGFDPLLA